MLIYVSDLTSSPSAVLRTLAIVASSAGPAAAAVLGILVGLALRPVLLLARVDRGRGAVVSGLRALAIVGYGALAGLLAMLLRESFAWDRRALLTFGVALLVATGPTLWLWLRGRRPSPRSITGLLLRAVLVLIALLCAAIVLMRTGFVALVSETPLLLVELTGETRPQKVRWMAPDQPLREEALTTHRVILKTPQGEPVAEAWLYGDQIAIKGRVLRLSPWLQLAGMHNLFELGFAHNGYLTAERHASQPHQSIPLVSRGPLSVHPRWRPLRDRLLQTWERKTDKDSEWAIRAATTESTYFPLVDGEGKPLRHTYTLVLTAGGLTGR